MDAFWLALGLVFVAELGDKSQLISLTFATRYPAWKVLVGVGVATAVMLGVSVALGHLVSVNLPTRVTGVVAGVLFLVFGVTTLRSGLGHHDDEDETSSRSTGRWPVVAIALTFLLAEFGDKTMLATITLASQQPWLPTWLGATLGMVSANAIAVLIGSQVGERLPMRVLAYVTSGLFFAVGVLLLVRSLT